MRIRAHQNGWTDGNTHVHIDNQAELKNTYNFVGKC